MRFELVPIDVTQIEPVHRLYRRWERYWNVPQVTSLQEVAHLIGAPYLDPLLDVRGVWLEGELVAFGRVSHIPSGERLERVALEGKVEPSVRGCGIGRHLFAWQIERAVEKLRRCDPALPWYIRTREWDWIDDAQGLYRRFGFHQARWFEDLIRPLDRQLEVAIPDGVEILPWEAASDEETLRVCNESFEDHWGSTRRSPDGWRHTLASATMRPDLSVVARAGDDLIGLCLNQHIPDDRLVTGRSDGWITLVGVLRPWRQRGVASALIARSLASFAEAGLTHAMIRVDAASPTGASRLYRRLGFEPLYRSVVSERRIEPSFDP